MASSNKNFIIVFITDFVLQWKKLRIRRIILFLVDGSNGKLSGFGRFTCLLKEVEERMKD